MVDVGLTAPAVTNTLPSTMNRFLTSCACPDPVTTLLPGSSPCGLCPSGASPSAQQGNGIDGVGAGGLEDLGSVGDAVVEHLPAVVAESVAYLWGGDAVAVGEIRVERDLVVLFGQVFADDAEVDCMAKFFGLAAWWSEPQGIRPAPLPWWAVESGPKPRLTWKA